MAAPHKIVLKDLLEDLRTALVAYEGLVVRLEAAVARLEGLSPPTALPPPDAAAVEAADRYIRARVLELGGVGASDE